MLRAVLDTSSLVSYILTRGEIMRRVIGHWRANHYVLLSSPQTRAAPAAVQFLLALELSMLDATGMARRFDRDTLVDIQETLLLESETADRLVMAVDLAKRGDGIR